MNTDTRLGTFAAIVAPHSPEVRRIATALRALIIALHPETFETPRLGENGATYGIGPKKMTEAYAIIAPLKSGVNLGFYHGVALPDPKQLLTGTGKRARHVRVSTVAEAAAPALRALIAAAVKERQAAVKP